MCTAKLSYLSVMNVYDHDVDCDRSRLLAIVQLLMRLYCQYTLRVSEYFKNSSLVSLKAADTKIRCQTCDTTIP